MFLVFSSKKCELLREAAPLFREIGRVTRVEKLMRPTKATPIPQQTADDQPVQYDRRKHEERVRTWVGRERGRTTSGQTWKGSGVLMDSKYLHGRTMKLLSKMFSREVIAHSIGIYI